MSVSPDSCLCECWFCVTQTLHVIQYWLVQTSSWQTNVTGFLSTNWRWVTSGKRFTFTVIKHSRISTSSSVMPHYPCWCGRQRETWNAYMYIQACKTNSWLGGAGLHAHRLVECQESIFKITSPKLREFNIFVKSATTFSGISYCWFKTTLTMWYRMCIYEK